MSSYTPHLQQQDRCTIHWFYSWTWEISNWRVLLVIIRIKLSSMENQIQKWNELNSRSRDGTRGNRISELITRKTWRSTRGHVRNTKHRVHHGKYPTCGWYLWQHKCPQKSFDTPRISNISMETSIPYLPSIRHLPLNWLRHDASTHIWTP